MAASLRQLFDEAAAIPEPQREEWLLEHCPDPALRAAVQALLVADREASTQNLLRPIADIVDLDPPVDGPATGTAIGPFILDECIGQGGSSSVHRAHRDLDGVRQTVALKILRRGIAAPESRRQFDRERQALAQLQHPHIAQFIDGGVTADGSAWLALEFVDGVPITTYVRERSVDFRQRIALMISVARAVAAAHRRLIVHRDLKPGNVLVSTDGHVKLLDFGIAKLLGDEADSGRTMTRAFTPAYAAPEQREGGSITTATDVYALGILLGELVTGKRLTDSGSGTPSSQISGDTAPGVLPAEPAQTRRLVKGDLDNILLKALDEEPERRYATAEALADDLERLLDGRPVLAHPPSGWYRFRRMVQRNKVPSALLGLLAIALLASTLIANQQARNAERELQKSTEIAAFLTKLFESTDLGAPRASLPTTDELLRDASARAQSAALDHQVKQDLLLMLGRIQRRLDLNEQARPLLQSAYQNAQGLDDLKSLGAQSEWALLELGSGNYKAALAASERSLALITDDNHSAARLRLELLNTQMLAHLYLGELPDAEAASTKVQRWLAQSQALDMGDERLAILESQAQILQHKGEFAATVSLREELLAEYEKRYGADYEKSFVMRYALGDARRLAGDLAGARALLVKCVEDYPRFYPEPGDMLVTIQHSLAATALAELKLDEAKMWWQKNHELLKSLAHADQARYSTLQGLSMVAYMSGSFSEALPLAQESTAAAIAVFGESGTPVAYTQRLTGQILAKLKRFDEAVAAIEGSSANLRTSEGESSPTLRSNKLSLLSIEIDRGSLAAAQAALSEIKSFSGPMEPRTVLEIEFLEARLRRLENDLPAAVSVLRAMIPKARATQGGTLFEMRGLTELGELEVMVGELESAEQSLTDALTLRQAQQPRSADEISRIEAALKKARGKPGRY